MTLKQCRSFFSDLKPVTEGRMYLRPSMLRKGWRIYKFSTGSIRKQHIEELQDFRNLIISLLILLSPLEMVYNFVFYYYEFDHTIPYPYLSSYLVLNFGSMFMSFIRSYSISMNLGIPFLLNELFMKVPFIHRYILLF